MSDNPRHRKLRYKGIDALIHGIQTANDNAQSQRTSNSGSVFIPSGNLDEDGQPDGTGTIIGNGANSGGIAPWVNDLIPPGKPLGLSVSSKTGMIFVTWDGSIEGGVPDDFDHVQIMVDNNDVGWLATKGTVTSGPYDIGSIHSIVAYAYDNAHSSDGNPAPNRSQVSDQLSVTISGAEIDEASLGITVTQSDKDPQGKGSHIGDLWLKYPLGLSANAINDPAMTSPLAEWSWNGLGMGLVTNPSGNWVRMRPNTGWNQLNNTGTITLQGGDVVEVSVDLQCEIPQDGINMYLGIKDGSGKDIQKKITAPGYGKWVNSTVRVQVPTGATVGPYQLDFSVNNTTGNTNTVVLCKNVSMAKVVRAALEAEWWWDGSKWVQIPVAIYLDQLAARDVQVDNAVIGMLAAGIIKSGTFVTTDGLVGFDSSGFWVKDPNNNFIFKASREGVQAVGGFSTALTGNRIIISQTLVQGTKIGGIQGQDGDDSNAPNWYIWGYGTNTGKDKNPSMEIGVSPGKSEIQVTKGSNGSVVALTADYIAFQGNKSISINSNDIKVRHTIPANFEDYDISQYLGWSSSFQNYHNATRLYERAGVIYLELNILSKNGPIPPNVTIPAVRLSSAIMPDHSLDVLAFGTSYAVGRFHVFGPNESQPQGTISIGTKDSTADFFSAEMFWADPRK